jgi:hypothetical protein
MTGNDATKPTDEYRRTFCPPDRPLIRAEDQKGLRNPHHWPATDPLDHPDTED